MINSNHNTTNSPFFKFLSSKWNRDYSDKKNEEVKLFRIKRMSEILDFARKEFIMFRMN